MFLGDYQSRVNHTLSALDKQAFSKRLWDLDPSLWKQEPDAEAHIANRLGWLDVVEVMKERVDDIVSFAEEIKNDGFTHAVLIGMGGSSLSPEVFKETFGVKEGYPELFVLDSNIPEAVLKIENKIDLAKTLFIVATKSGTTMETMQLYRYFFNTVSLLKGEPAGDNFIAITDYDTPLEDDAREKEFRRIIFNFPDIGGRYSALSYFGLVPAALIGVDINLLLERAEQMIKSCSADVELADNPGIVLGSVISQLAMMGHDKMTLISSTEIKCFGGWVEQLVAESTGKNGTGIIPIVDEPLASPENYNADRLFVYIRLASTQHKELDDSVQTLIDAKFPVVRIDLADIYDLGQEYFRWEMATATASALMGVNAFDEPNVKESKVNTKMILEKYDREGRLPHDELIIDERGIKLYGDIETKEALDRIIDSESMQSGTLEGYLSAYLHQFQPGNYFSLMAYLEPSAETYDLLQRIRGRLQDTYKSATTLGYGPRFLHSTGQIHKGGPNSGIFLQFTADINVDALIPKTPYSFGILSQAQYMGDAISLRKKGRRLIRVHMSSDVLGGLKEVLDTISPAVSEISQG